MRGPTNDRSLLQCQSSTITHIEILLSAARPLPPSDHAAFLEEPTDTLANCPELGDGVVYRVARQLQRKFFDPPDLSNDSRSRWRR